MSGILVACAGRPRAAPVTPAEIPTLRTQAAQHPTNAQIRFRLAAALMATGRCDTATVVANAARALAPAEPLGPMVIGGCQEKDGRYDLAFATYTDFARKYPQARGVAAVRARAQFALRTQATQNAKLALARESTLTALAPEPSTVAVLPLTIAGDSSLQPLSRGLAELLLTDLAMVRSLRLLERIQVGALLDELKLGQSGRAEASTAARVGRLLRAERMVQGVAAITENGPVRMSATVVRGDGSVRSGAQANGTFKQLLDLEKQLVFGLATELGIQLTEAERQRILRQGPKNLAAFLAYSEGLEALDRGDYRGAAAAFAQAVRADPTFQAAVEQQQAAEAAPAVQATAGDVVSAVEAAAQVPPPAEPVTDVALKQVTVDVSPAIGDLSGQTGIGSTVSNTTSDSQGISSIVQASGIIRIIFRRP
ncbi:MAG TPA: CsgG/HfaB family protein [Gemmatimonadales bacterium]|jgi:tetratricopeptide (TPR) repeat protein|nr:CsgG/HfaB family protein [Gemmatimonadales bacterium]